MTPEELKDRTCSFEDCRHLNSENICCIHNQENCILYRLKKENAELKAQIEIMECCENCVFFKEKTYNICRDIKKLGTRKCSFYRMMRAIKEIKET